MEVPRLGVESELSLPAYARATAMPDPSLICDLHHSSRQAWILNPRSQHATSWFLVGFVSAAPKRELPELVLFLLFFFFFSFWPHLWHVEVPGLGMEFTPQP